MSSEDVIYSDSCWAADDNDYTDNRSVILPQDLLATLLQAGSGEVSREKSFFQKRKGKREKRLAFLAVHRQS